MTKSSSSSWLVPLRTGTRANRPAASGDTTSCSSRSATPTAIIARQLQSCREAGLLTLLVHNAHAMAELMVWRGDFGAAASLTGQGHGIQVSHRVSAVLYNALGRWEAARAEAQQAADEAPELFSSMWALAELIEAASRSGQTRLAADTLGRLAEATSVGQTGWGQGIYAGCRALLADGEDAERWYREAVGGLSRTSLRPELARAHLLYGEWLRREGRRTDARAQLRTAHGMFDVIGMQAFAERARRELLATGESIRGSTDGPRDQLTPQEAQIAGLARAGMSNPEIAAQLFLSARTVEWHLGRSTPNLTSPPADSSSKRFPTAPAPGRRRNRVMPRCLAAVRPGPAR